MRTTTGWQSIDGSATLKLAPFERRDLRDDDIAVRIDYCGVCHSDLHVLNAVHGKRDGILVPRHEFTGTVTKAGPAVTGFAPGARVAVGTIVDSCGICAMCQAGEETYCAEFPSSPTRGLTASTAPIGPGSQVAVAGLGAASST